MILIKCECGTDIALKDDYFKLQEEHGRDQIVICPYCKKTTDEYLLSHVKAIFERKENGQCCDSIYILPAEEIESCCVDYYTANGWKVGKNSMKDWEAAVRTWKKNGLDPPTEPNTTYGYLNDPNWGDKASRSL